MKKVKIATLNIGNPSLERAQKQIEWIKSTDIDIFILTETKNSKGCNEIERVLSGKELDLFTESKDIYHIFFPKSITKDLGTMIVSKFPFKWCNTIFDNNHRFFSRYIDCSIEIEEKKVLKVSGLYVPSRDRSPEKIERKKEFLATIKKHIYENKNIDIIAGDFNILTRCHTPKYSNYFHWEYDFWEGLNFIDTYDIKSSVDYEHTWIGRTGNGYRYDYILSSEKKFAGIKKRTVIEEPKFLGLTDHFGIEIELIVD